MKTTVILGGGGAGLFCGATIKKISPQDQVFIISDEDLFCRCSSPYVISNRSKIEDTIMSDSMTTSMGVDLLKGTAVNINHEEKVITYYGEENEETISYDSLVFATGMKSSIPPIEGNVMQNVFPMRRAEHLSAIVQEIGRSSRAVVIGGVIGIEIASALRERELDVSLLTLDENLLYPHASKVFSKYTLEHLTNSGVKCFTNAIVQEIEGDDNVADTVIFTHEGEEKYLQADFIVLATGGKPNTELATQCGVNIEPCGIPVDEYLQTNIPNIYAVGDVAIAKNMVTGKNSISQLATNAIVQGKIAGRNIAGFKTPYAGHTSAMGLQFLGKEFGSCGVSERICKELDIEYIKISTDSTDVYKDLIEASLVHMEIIFEKNTLQVLGAQVFGKNTVWCIDTISLALQNKNTAFDMLSWNYVSHPAFSPWPFMNPIVNCSEKAIQESGFY